MAKGNETVTNCDQLKMVAPDGKMRETDVATAEQLLRLVQSIPSKKAEPFKLWLARADGRVICFFNFLVEKRLNFDYDKFIKGG